MSNAYRDLKNKHQEEVNKFPIKFAFSESQFVKAMQELGLTPEDRDKIAFVGYQGFLLKEDEKTFFDMLERHGKEMKEAIASDLTGEGFIYDMFLYELKNMEYGYTRDAEPTLEYLNLTFEQVKADPRLQKGFTKARIMSY